MVRAEAFYENHLSGGDPLKERFERELTLLTEQGLFRDLHKLPAVGGMISINGRNYLNFSSNDYLNLSKHPEVKSAAIRAIETLGCGATASRLMAGHLQLHEELEADLARLVRTEAALVFGSGFLSSLGVISTLATQDDIIFADQLNHASLIDGAKLSRAKCYRYRHKNLEHLESLLNNSDPAHGRIILSDSLFSMDGDIAPLEGLAELANRYEALLVIDEAHAIGIFGNNGGGICQTESSTVRPDVILGTLSKSLGGYGGFVACSATMRQYLINRARSFIFSTGLPPACIASARAAISVIQAEPERGPQLLAKARWFRELLVEAGFNLPPFESQIIPLYIGDNERVVLLSRLLWEQGILVTGVRSPTVPVGTARIRLSVNLEHKEEALQAAVKSMAALVKNLGIQQLASVDAGSVHF